MSTIETSAAKETPACPLCDAPQCGFLFEKDEAPFYGCTRCSFRFAAPKRNANLENTLGEFESSYIQYFDEAPRDTVNFDRLTAWMERYHALNGVRVLDVGAGSGKFVRYLRRRGVEAFGLEPSRALYGHYLSKDTNFACQTLHEFAASSPKPFDVITAFDVIEHVEDPAATIARIAELLAPGGHAFISTPDAGCLHAKIMGRRWHYYHRYHLSYWSRRTLGEVAKQHGLTERYFGQRSRYQTMGYVMAYGWEHFVGKKAPAIFTHAEAVSFPINLFDVMYLCFEKDRV